MRDQPDQTLTLLQAIKTKSTNQTGFIQEKPGLIHSYINNNESSITGIKFCNPVRTEALTKLKIVASLDVRDERERSNFKDAHWKTLDRIDLPTQIRDTEITIFEPEKLMKNEEIEDFRFEELEDLQMDTKNDMEKRMYHSSSSSPSSASASSSSSAASSLAAKAIRASSAHRDSSLSSAYSSPSSAPVPTPPKEVSNPHQYTSMKSLNEPKRSFWGSLASKAKAFLDEDDTQQPPQSPKRTEHNIPSSTSGTKEAGQTGRKSENPSLQRSLDAITSSLNYISGTIGNVVEEGITAVENRTAGIIQETRKKIKKKPSLTKNQQNPDLQADLEVQLKASRDVAMAMAAKAKLLLRELKMVKSERAFAKQRCAQLEEENKILRESRNGGNSQTDDDDLVRLQLETLLAEKARLAHENSIYARENLYLRGVVEYHQLTMQDVVYFDEKTEEVTEVYPINVTSMSSSSDNSHTTNPKSFGAQVKHINS